MNRKSTVDEIRQRFDADVQRFSNLETGQTATVDAALAMQLVAEAAAATTPHATHVLDVGCGAGNYALKLLQLLPHLNVTLIDLSRPMLDRAATRIRDAGCQQVRVCQQDIRDAELNEREFDLILAAAVLHHLRSDGEWESVFEKLYRALRPGGSLWVFDMVESTSPATQQLMWRRYGDYLECVAGPDYRQKVFAYIQREDSPRSLMYQLQLLQRAGFTGIDVLHKNTCFAAFGGAKA